MKTVKRRSQVAQMADAIRKVLRKALLALDLPTESDSEAPDAHKRRADEHIAAQL